MTLQNALKYLKPAWRIFGPRVQGQAATRLANRLNTRRQKRYPTVNTTTKPSACNCSARPKMMVIPMAAGILIGTIGGFILAKRGNK